MGESAEVGHYGVLVGRILISDLLPGYHTAKTYSRVSIHHDLRHQSVMPDKNFACSLPSTANSWIPGSLSWQEEARSLAPCIAPQHTLHTIHAVSGCPAEVQLHVDKDCASMVLQWPRNETYQVGPGYTACISIISLMMLHL